MNKLMVVVYDGWNNDNVKENSETIKKNVDVMQEVYMFVTQKIIYIDR